MDELELLPELMGLIEEGGWSGLDLPALAIALDIPSDELISRYGTIYGALAACARAVDRAVAEEVGPPNLLERPRDRIFERLIARFEALAPYREAIRRLVRAAPLDPALGATLTTGLPASMAHMLESAGISTRGPLGFVRVNGLVALWLATARVWLEDESPDLGKTMAALDRNLARVDGLAARFLGGDMGEFREDGSEEAAEDEPPVLH